MAPSNQKAVLSAKLQYCQACDRVLTLRGGPLHASWHAQQGLPRPEWTQPPVGRERPEDVNGVIQAPKALQRALPDGVARFKAAQRCCGYTRYVAGRAMYEWQCAKSPLKRSLRFQDAVPFERCPACWKAPSGEPAPLARVEAVTTPVLADASPPRGPRHTFEVPASASRPNPAFQARLLEALLEEAFCVHDLALRVSRNRKAVHAELRRLHALGLVRCRLNLEDLRSDSWFVPEERRQEALAFVNLHRKNQEPSAPLGRSA